MNKHIFTKKTDINLAHLRKVDILYCSPSWMTHENESVCHNIISDYEKGNIIRVFSTEFLNTIPPESALKSMLNQNRGDKSMIGQNQKKATMTKKDVSHALSIFVKGSPFISLNEVAAALRIDKRKAHALLGGLEYWEDGRRYMFLVEQVAGMICASKGRT